MTSTPAQIDDEPILTFELFGDFEIEAPTQQGLSEIASQLNHEIDARLKEGNCKYLEAGYFLHVMKESKAYKALGSHIKTWGDYLSDRGLSIGTDNNLRGIAMVFGKALEEHPELQKADYKRLADILPMFRTKGEELENYRRLVLAPAAPMPEQSLDLSLDEEESGDTVIDVEFRDVTEDLGDERRTEIQDEPLSEEALKISLLRDAVSLPKKGWESQLQELRGKRPADSCDHSGQEFDILHRCRGCGQLYSPNDGHTDHYKELDDMGGDELISEYLTAIEDTHGADARAKSLVEERGDKFRVFPFQKGPSGIYSTNMNAKSYSRKGFINLIIERKAKSQ